MAIHLKKGCRREPVRELVNADDELLVAANQSTVDFPDAQWSAAVLRGGRRGRRPSTENARRFDSHDFAFMSKGHDAMRAHRVKPYDVPFAMQTAAHSIIQRRRMDGYRRIVVDFADS